MSRPLETEFRFAGFSFPRRVPMLRRVGKRFHVSTSYYVAPPPSKNMTGFYLESDFALGLRWDWVDQFPEGPRVSHRGWYTSDGCDETVRGLVFRLPRGRGLLAGWARGEGMIGAVETDTIWGADDVNGACFRADQLAEEVAEVERESNREQESEED